ncbi:Ankyrin repeat domain-containing protein 16 [Desmophyllum pertusum]|uniref:Ankyrin repeat domain-containing protein 16 n=1 Tax=Desmophyllum pertusum TaxID=174260 RepID=A0A9W9YV59_9CNID|nr:Ankyrin repeat domain-containing protein 16 [Desmophyllum pertusum]
MADVVDERSSASLRSEDFIEYPLPLRLIQGNKESEFISMVDSHTDGKAILNCVHSRSGDTPIIVASRHGHLDLLKFLIHRGVDIEQRNKDLKRASHEAAAGCHLECVKLLILQNAEIDCLKTSGLCRTPLMLSCTKLNIDVIRTLVQGGANLRLTNKDGWNFFILPQGQAEILNYLLDCCNDIWDSCSKNGRTPLHTAALHGRVDAIKLMISRCDYTPDCPDSCGSTPLMDALRAGHVLVAETLVNKHKASITTKDQLGRQGIHLAAQAGCNKSLDYIITQHGADVNVCTESQKWQPCIWQLRKVTQKRFSFC